MKHLVREKLPTPDDRARHLQGWIEELSEALRDLAPCKCVHPGLRGEPLIHHCVRCKLLAKHCYDRAPRP